MFLSNFNLWDLEIQIQISDLLSGKIKAKDFKRKNLVLLQTADDLLDKYPMFSIFSLN